MRRAVTRVVGLVSLVLASACPTAPPIHLPGVVKGVDLVVKLAALNDAQANGIGSFNMKVLHDGAVERELPLNFSASSRTLAFLEEPKDLPTTGTLAFTLQAVNLVGDPLPIGGKSGVINLDALPVGGAQLLAVVGNIGAPTPLGIDLAGGVLPDVVVAVGTGVLLVSGSDAEWIDLATGRHCQTGDAGCAFGDVPASPAIGLALADGFAPACAHRGAALVGFGADGSAALFDPAGLDGAGAFTALSTGFGDRSGARAFATAGCRAFIVGAGAVGVVDLTTGDAHSDPVADAAALDAAVVDLGDALEERALIGGRLAQNATDTAFVTTPSAGGAAICALGSAGCNGAAASMRCARDTPSAARIDDGTDRAPTLVIGGDCVGHESGSLFGDVDAPFNRFVDVDHAPAVVRPSGAAVVPFGRDTALIIGGLELSTGLRTGSIEKFTLSDIDPAGDIAHGTFAVQPGTVTARAGHTVVSLGGALVVVGGGTPKIEVIVAELE